MSQTGAWGSEIRAWMGEGESSGSNSYEWMTLSGIRFRWVARGHMDCPGLACFSAGVGEWTGMELFICGHTKVREIEIESYTAGLFQ